MATKIPEPGINQPGDNDWQILLYKTTFIGYSINDIEVNNDIVKQGSRFMLNGSLFSVFDDEQITGWNPNWANYSNIYVYAVTNGDNLATFNFSVMEPTFDAAKGGWFSGNARALAFGFKVNNIFYVTEYIMRIRMNSQLLSIASRGHINAAYDVVTNTILANSTYEANGRMWGNISNQVVSGWSSGWANGSYVYIYAIDESPNSRYTFDTTNPTLDMSRAGYYNGNYRCIAIGVKDSAGFSLITWLFPWHTLTPMRSLVYEGNNDTILTLSPGRYLAILRGGKGGKGGGSGIYVGLNGTQEIISQEFFVGGSNSVNAELYVGRDGLNGSDGITASPQTGGGGGGGGGMEAVLRIPAISLTLKARGGNGGNGASFNANGAQATGYDGAGGAGGRSTSNTSIGGAGGVNGSNGSNGFASNGGNGGNGYIFTHQKSSGGGGGAGGNNNNNRGGDGGDGGSTIKTTCSIHRLF